MQDIANQYANVRYDMALKSLVVEFTGFIPFPEFVKITQAEFSLIRKHNIQKCLIDIRKIPVYASGMSDYIRDVWFPTVSRDGLKYVAFIIPEATLGQMSMKKAHETHVNNVVVNHFATPQAALTWLNRLF